MYRRRKWGGGGFRRRFHRRSRKATWSFADEVTLTSGMGANIAWAWLLPPGRVGYLLNSGSFPRNHLLYAGSHLWFDFHWRSTASGPTQLASVDFGVIKTTISDPVAFTPDLSLVEAQWNQPSTPGSIMSWEDDDDDGTDSFLWSHRIHGNGPPNSIIWQSGGAPSGATQVINNQGNLIDGKGSDNPTQVCRTFHVETEWQPSVVVHSKRRLQKDEGILLFMNAAITVAGQFCDLFVNQRTLTR